MAPIIPVDQPVKDWVVPSPSRSQPTVWVDDLTLQLQIQTFLDSWTCQIVRSSLARTWNRRRSVQSALDVLEINGVEFQPGAKEQLVTMDIEAI